MTSKRTRTKQRITEPKDPFEAPERKAAMREWIVVIFLAMWGLVAMSAMYNYYADRAYYIRNMR